MRVVARVEGQASLLDLVRNGRPSLRLNDGGDAKTTQLYGSPAATVAEARGHLPTTAKKLDIFAII